MAAPTWVSSTAQSSGTTTTTCTVTLPTTAANDILIITAINGGANAAVTLPGAGTYNGSTITAIGSGAGWTSGWGATYWTRCTGNHSGQTIILTGATDSCSMQVVRYSGCITTGNPYDTNISQATVAAGANCALAAFDTTVADTLVVYCVAMDDNQAFSLPTKGGAAMNNLASASSSGGADSSAGSADLAQAGTGTTGAFSMTCGAGTNQGKRATAFALKPDVTPQTINGGVASHSNTAVGGTASNPNTISGGRALENDAAVTAFPGIGYSRSFDDVDDEITCAIGSAGVTGAFTIAALVRSRAAGEVHPIFGMYNASNQAQMEIELATSGQAAARVANAARTIDSADAAGSVYWTDGWVIVAISKPAGTAELTFHVWKQTAPTWLHAGALADLPSADPGASTYVKFGRLGVTTIYGELDLAVAGVWNVELTNTQVEELAGGATQDWYDQSGGTPVALWDFNQASTATDVVDLVGDADQTAIVGTSINGGPPNPEWDYGLAAPQTISGGVANENDSAPSATVAQGFFRRFDGVDDRVYLTNGQALLYDDLTMAALLRRGRDGEVEWVIYNVQIGGSECIGIGFNAANQITMRLGFSGTVRKTTSLTVTASDGWVIVAVSKAGSTSTPRAHVWKQGSGWTHQDMDGTLANPVSQINGYVVFGASNGFELGPWAQMDLHTAGEWRQNLSDAEVEELSTDWATVDWFDHSVDVPCGLWNFNQSSAPTGNGIDTGVIDLTGGGGGPFGNVEGTSAVVGAPVRTSDSKVWDPATPLVGGIAEEHNLPGSVIGGGTTPTLPGLVVQTFGTVTESDSAVGGAIGAVAHDRDIDDTIQGTDAFESEAAYARLTADTIAGTDTSIRAPAKALADAIAATDALVAGRSIPVAIGDTISATDSVPARALSKAIADAAMIADVLQGVEQNRHSLSDDVAATDSVRLHLAKALADATAGTDASIRKPSKGIADTAQGTDASTRRPTKAIADAASLADDTDIAAEGAYQVDIDDTIQGTDASVRSVGKPVADAIAGTDARAKAATHLVADGAAITDAIETDVIGAGLELEIDDAIAATDAFGRQADSARSISDSVAATDSAVVSSGYARAISDSIQAADVHARAPGVRLADLLAGADALERQLVLLRTISDLAYVTDAFDVLRPDWTYGGDGDFAYAGAAVATYGGDDDWTYSEEDSHYDD